MEKEQLAYADRTAFSRLSRMAVLAPLVAVAGFPLSPHWVFESNCLPSHVPSVSTVTAWGWR